MALGEAVKIWAECPFQMATLVEELPMLLLRMVRAFGRTLGSRAEEKCTGWVGQRNVPRFPNFVCAKFRAWSTGDRFHCRSSRMTCLRQRRLEGSIWICHLAEQGPHILAVATFALKTFLPTLAPSKIRRSFQELFSKRSPEKLLILDPLPRPVRPTGTALSHWQHHKRCSGGPTLGGFGSASNVTIPGETFCA